jgi:hypothetical protein
VRGYIHKNIKTPNQTSANLKTYDQTLLPNPLDQQKLSIAKCIQNIRNQETSRLTTKLSDNNCTNSKSFKTIECSKHFQTTSTISRDLIKETTMLTEKPVSLEIAKQTIISKQEAKRHFTKSINIRLIDQFNEVVDETNAVDTDDDEQNEVAVNLRMIRRTNHREDTIDARTVSILQKLNIYSPKIRTVSSKLKSISRPIISDSIIFTTPRSITKDIKLTTHLVTSGYTNRHSTVTMNSDTLKSSLIADYSLVTTNSTLMNKNDDLEFINICDMLYDTRQQNHTCELTDAPRHVLLSKNETRLVTEFETPMRILPIKTSVRYQPTDAIDDRVILQYDPGGSQMK